MNKETTAVNSDIIKSYDRFLPYQFIHLLGKKSITDVKLGDQVEKEMTVLFSDIRNFTALSENMSPQENFNFINTYLLQMEPIIGEHFGIIDKYIGDAIMALFPTNSNDALNASICMLNQLADYNIDRKKNDYSEIKIGIGLNTGYLMLGTVGSKNRMEGTVIGDVVNLSSRLESLTKVYNTKLLISEHTYHNLQNIKNYFIRFIDRIRVKGKKQPVSIYEVFDNDEDRLKNKKAENVHIFEEALAHYHYKHIDQAEKLLREYLKIVPEDYPAKLYLRRCENFSKTGNHEGISELIQKINWKPQFEIGHREIDEQHKNLVETAYKLIDAVNAEAEQSKIIDIISFLNAYVLNHFLTEEKYMEDTKYPFISTQKRQHQKFIQDFSTLKDGITNINSKNKLYITFRIQILVIDWILNHTLKEDRHFGRFLQQQKNENK